MATENTAKISVDTLKEQKKIQFQSELVSFYDHTENSDYTILLMKNKLGEIVDT